MTRRRGLRLGAVLLPLALIGGCAGPGVPGACASWEAEPASDAERAPPFGTAGGEPAAAPEEDWLDEEWLDVPSPAEQDPFEEANRRIHGFNQGVQRWFFDPVARAYAFVLPSAGRRAVYRVFQNLGEPVLLVNHLIQMEGIDATVTGIRFVVNSTAGIAGLFDPALELGLARRNTDFGETLALYRVEAGPYLVLPVFGPSTARDAFGGVVDALLRPDAWILGLGPQFYSLVAGQGVSLYDARREQLDALRESSVDFYSALRAAYLLSREAAVEARIEHVCADEAPHTHAAAPLPASHDEGAEAAPAAGAEPAVAP